MLVQDAEDGHEEAVSTGALLAVHVKHSDVALDSHSRRALGRVMLAQVGDRAITEEASPLAHLSVKSIREDDSTGVARVHDVLDPDRDAGTDDLIHGEGVDDLRTIEGQFSSLARGDRVKKASGRHLAWVSGKDTVDFLPDLQLLGTQANSSESSTQVGVATAHVLQEASRNSAEVASNDRHSIVAVCVDTRSNGKGQVLVELVVQTLSNQLESDDIAQVDVDGVGAAILQESSHVQAAELLADRNDHVVGLVRDRLEELGALQDLEQLEALGVDFLSKVLLDQVVGDGILAGLDVVDTNGLDNVAELLRLRLEDIPSSAQKAVSRTLALGRGAARRADNSDAVFAQACTVSDKSAIIPYQDFPKRLFPSASAKDLSAPHLQHNVLSDSDRELAHARTAEFLHDPVASGRQVLLLLVYSIDLELHCECEVGAGG